jgi:hypothetical protein
MLDGFLKAQSPATCRSYNQPRSNSSTISRPPGAIGLDIPPNVIALADAVID